MPHLEKWSVIHRGTSDFFTAPELQIFKLTGWVSDHPSFNDGERITTSGVKDVGNGVVKTYNSIYTLGKIDDEWIKWCEDNDHEHPNTFLEKVMRAKHVSDS
jgi:hypothetical protein